MKRVKRRELRKIKHSGITLGETRDRKCSGSRQKKPALIKELSRKGKEVVIFE